MKVIFWFAVLMLFSYLLLVLGVGPILSVLALAGATLGILGYYADDEGSSSVPPHHEAQNGPPRTSSSDGGLISGDNEYAQHKRFIRIVEGLRKEGRIE
jgi:hypothetical protein